MEELKVKEQEENEDRPEENTTAEPERTAEYREEFWIPKEDLCRKCQRKRVDRSENRNSILCHECREEQIRYPFPKKMLPAVALVLVLMVLAMARTPKVLQCYKNYTEAERQAAVGDIYPALLGLQSVLDVYPDSVPVADRMTSLAMWHGYYDVAAYVMNEYLEGQSVDDAVYAKLDGFANKLNRYYNTIDRISILFEGITGDMSEEDQTEELESIQMELLDMTKSGEYDKALTYYYLGALTEDQDQALTYLQASVDADYRLAIAQVALGTNLRRRGDLTGAGKAYETVLAQDRNDTGALRAMGILKMLEGNKEAGLSDVRRAFDLNPEEAYVRETLIIALMESGNMAEADQMKQQFEEEGIVFDEEFENYRSGAVNLYDYYVSPEQ